MESTGQLHNEQRGRVLLLRLSNPAMRNAMSPEIYQRGWELIEAAGRDGSIGAIVIAGEGAHFCAGGNVHRLRANREKPRSVPHGSVGLFHQWISAIARCPKPVLAAVEGVAAGGGFSLALACDLLVAAENARFMMSYVNIGLSPDGGGAFWLATALPRPLALEVLLEGGVVEAARLHAMGLANRIVRSGEAVDAAVSWAAKLAAGPPEATARIKRLVQGARNRSLAEHLDAERDGIVGAMYSAEAAEGLDAFVEKRRPDFFRR